MCRFQQQRVHIRVGCQSAGFCLDGLCTSYFASLRCRIGIQGHVLSLERCRGITVLPENPAESGVNDAFSRIRTGTDKHDRFQFHGRLYIETDKRGIFHNGHVCHFECAFAFQKGENGPVYGSVSHRQYAFAGVFLFYPMDESLCPFRQMF